MSLHSLHDYACHACREPYIPFAAGVRCPRCDEAPAETFEEFLEEVRGILELVWHAHGRWVPPANPMSTLGDHYVWLLAGALARAGLEFTMQEDDVAGQAEKAAAQVHLGAKEYLRPHYTAFFRALFPVALHIQRT